jgi:hypothetical protein
MEYTASVKEEVRKEATNIWLRIIEGVELALESNEDIFYIRDMPIMGDLMVYMMRRENWIENIDKARLYFESQEEYQTAIRCRDLTPKIIEQLAKISEL